MDSETPKPDTAPVPIWRCVNPECKVWVRDELAASDAPACPMCQGKMIRGIKHLPKLIKKHKTERKKKDETPWLS
ncbi:cold-inducible protein YdjO-related protein [Cohnella candidum]|uniref:Cold-shock protein n=1 Tax=Cohnella candidum TaxID=2674991 RepID=A0A3G3JXH4_9BACL|nr:cold-inducible protein YdjO-related protein [Cohnella candidum]AYQ72948.1 hypothetical protein EAV92_10465 [Cohnella candidum]